MSASAGIRHSATINKWIDHAHGKAMLGLSQDVGRNKRGRPSCRSSRLILRIDCFDLAEASCGLLWPVDFFSRAVARPREAACDPA